MNGSFLERLDRNGPVLVTLMILIVALAYMADAYMASQRIHNLIMLVPMTAIVVFLAVVVFVKELFIRRTRAGTVGDDPVPAQAAGTALMGITGASVGAIASMMAALIAYAVLTPWIGFDVASVLFIAFCLWVQGERRPLVVIGFSVVFGFGITWLLVNGARAPATTTIIPGL